MTVLQLIDKLKQYPGEALVYVPISMSGKNGTVQFVARVPHLDLLIKGITIDDDVALLPGEMESFILEPGASDEERQGDS